MVADDNEYCLDESMFKFKASNAYLCIHLVFHAFNFTPMQRVNIVHRRPLFSVHLGWGTGQM